MESIIQFKLEILKLKLIITQIQTHLNQNIRISTNIYKIKHIYFRFLDNFNVLIQTKVLKIKIFKEQSEDFYTDIKEITSTKDRIMLFKENNYKRNIKN